MAPYSYQLALSMREDWMYFYLYPSSNGPVYVLPYLDGAASGAVPVAALPSSTISQLLRLSAQSPSIQTQDDLLSAIRQADAVQCCKGRAYSSTPAPHLLPRGQGTAGHPPFRRWAPHRFREL